ncbi:unnamed protein product [Prunus armeniaca]
MRFWWWCCGQGDFRRLSVNRMNTLNMSMNLVNTLNIEENLLHMSESSNKESHDPPAFGRDDTESEEPSEYVCSEGESSQTEGLVEGIIESRLVVHDGEIGEPLVDSRKAEYREMQRNYKVLEAVANRVLALPHTPEVGSSNQASPSWSMGVAMASTSKGVDIRVGVPLARWNILTEVKLAELRTDYSVPPYVGLRLPTAVDVVRYPPEGSVMIFTNMYQHGLKLPFHPWVQMMLAKLGYALGQYNPNF